MLLHCLLAVAKQLGLEICGLEGVAQLIDKTLDKGLVNTDYSALYQSISKPNK